VSEPKRLLSLLVPVAALVVIQQAADLLAMLPGSDLAVPAGRIRQLLAVESRSLAVIAADVLLIWSLLLRGRKRALSVLGTGHGILGVFLVLAAPLFLRDAATLAAGFAGATQNAFRIVVARMVVMLIALGILALWVGQSLRSASRETVTPA
jgi:hypothetical protein